MERIEKILSAKDMPGRKTFTPGIDSAVDFIAVMIVECRVIDTRQE